MLMILFFLVIGGICACGKKRDIVSADIYEDTENVVFPTSREEEERKKEHPVLTRHMSDDFYDEDLVILHSGNKSEYSKANLIPDAEHHREGTSISGAFDASVQDLFQIPTEYHPFEYVCFWMYLERACTVSVSFRLNCSDEKGESSYFSYSFPLDWSGWKLMTVPFDMFSKQGGHNPDIATLHSIRMEYVIRENNQATDKNTISYIDSIFFANNLYEYDWTTNQDIDNALETALDTLRALLQQEGTISDSLIDIGAANWANSICSIDSLHSSGEMNAVYDIIYKAAITYVRDEDYHNQKMLDSILDALYYMDQTFFSQRNRVSFANDNWWNWEIGVPTKIVNTLVILSEDIEDRDIYRLLKTIDMMNRLPARTDANQLSIGYCAMVSAILQRDYKRVINCREILTEALKYTSFEGGFYEDGSYIDHLYIPYNGSYGCVYIANMSKLITVLDGTVLAFDSSAVKRCISILKDSFLPFLFRGAMSASVRGRSISRKSSRDLTYGTQAIESMIMLYPLMKESDREVFKNAILSGYSGNQRRYRRNMCPYALDILDAILEEDKLPEVQDEPGVWYMSSMDRAVARMKNWAAYISLSGSRIAKYEAINGENQTGWYTGDGMIYLYTSQKDYGDAFWGGLDYYKIPGTTVTDLPRIATDIITSTTLTSCDFVGGCVQGDAMAVAMEWAGASSGMDFQTDLTGKKAWFIIDNMILCLGTDICCTDECGVYTVVDNRIIDDREVLADGQPIEEDGTARRIYISGYCGIISYQQEIQYQIVQEDNNQFLQAMVDHGQKPNGAGYCYAMYPLCTDEEFESLKPPGFKVIQNDGNVTAVDVGSKKMFIFWNAGTCDGMTVDYPCILIVGENGLCLSDPTHLQKVITVFYGEKKYAFNTDGSGETIEFMSGTK